MTAAPQSCARQSAMLLDIAHDKLYEGHWQDVPLAWRRMYTCASLLSAAAAMLRSDVAQALRTCDMALLMGAPVLDDLAAHVAANLQARIGSQAGVKHVAEDEAAPVLLVPGPVLAGGAWRSMHSDINDDIALCINNGSPHGVCRMPLPSLSDFDVFMRDGTPIVVTAAMTTWPALQRWNDAAYLLRVAGHRHVPIEVGSSYTAQDWSQGIHTLASFIRDHVLAAVPAKVCSRASLQHPSSPSSAGTWRSTNCSSRYRSCRRTYGSQPTAAWAAASCSK